MLVCCLTPVIYVMYNISTRIWATLACWKDTYYLVSRRTCSCQLSHFRCCMWSGTKTNSNNFTVQFWAELFSAVHVHILCVRSCLLCVFVLGLCVFSQIFQCFLLSWLSLISFFFFSSLNSNHDCVFTAFSFPPVSFVIVPRNTSCALFYLLDNNYLDYWVDSLHLID